MSLNFIFTKKSLNCSKIIGSKSDLVSNTQTSFDGSAHKL